MKNTCELCWSWRSSLLLLLQQPLLLQGQEHHQQAPCQRGPQGCNATGVPGRNHAPQGSTGGKALSSRSAGSRVWCCCGLRWCGIRWCDQRTWPPSCISANGCHKIACCTRYKNGVSVQPHGCCMHACKEVAKNLARLSCDAAVCVPQAAEGGGLPGRPESAVQKLVEVGPITTSTQARA
jgi:hypothetical protein